MEFIIAFMWALASIIFFSSSFLSFTLNTESFDGKGKKTSIMFSVLDSQRSFIFWNFNRIYICTACTDASFSRITRQNFRQKPAPVASFPEVSALVSGPRKNTLINVFTGINVLAELMNSSRNRKLKNCISLMTPYQRNPNKLPHQRRQLPKWDKCGH